VLADEGPVVQFFACIEFHPDNDTGLQPSAQPLS
jgi:hypothetical protein